MSFVGQGFRKGGRFGEVRETKGTPKLFLLRNRASWFSGEGTGFPNHPSCDSFCGFLSGDPNWFISTEIPMVRLRTGEPFQTVRLPGHGLRTPTDHHSTRGLSSCKASRRRLTDGSSPARPEISRRTFVETAVRFWFSPSSTQWHEARDAMTRDVMFLSSLCLSLSLSLLRLRVR